MFKWWEMLLFYMRKEKEKELSLSLQLYRFIATVYGVSDRKVSGHAIYSTKKHISLNVSPKFQQNKKTTANKSK